MSEYEKLDTETLAEGVIVSNLPLGFRRAVVAHLRALNVAEAERDAAVGVLADVRGWFAGSPASNSYEDLRAILAKAKE